MLGDKILQKQINEEKAETKTKPGKYVEWSEVHGVVQGEGWDWEQRLGKMRPFLYGVQYSGNKTRMDKRSQDRRDKFEIIGHIFCNIQLVLWNLTHFE